MNCTVHFIQKMYLTKVLQRFGTDPKTRNVSTPLVPSFLSLVGSLMYAILCARLNISWAINIDSRYMHDSRKGH